LKRCILLSILLCSLLALTCSSLFAQEDVYKELNQGKLTPLVQKNLTNSVEARLFNIPEDTNFDIFSLTQADIHKDNRLRRISFDGTVIKIDWNLRNYEPDQFDLEVYKNNPEKLKQVVKSRTTALGMTDVMNILMVFGIDYKMSYETDLKFDKIILTGYYNDTAGISCEVGKKTVGKVNYSSMEEIDMYNLLKSEAGNLKLNSPFDTEPKF